MRRLHWMCAVGICLASACAPSSNCEEEAPIDSHTLELDDMGQPPENVRLLTLARDADIDVVSRTLTDVGGRALHLLPPRLLIAEHAKGLDAILEDVGVRGDYARAVSPDEAGVQNYAERRFVNVFNSRYYASQLPRTERIVPLARPLTADEPFEGSEPDALDAPRTAALQAARTDAQQEERERTFWVPYASGKIVVSVVLPESNGRAEPSTEDWTEAQLDEVYMKVQAALEAFTRHEPNADLRFVIEQPSAPGRDGLEGTIDCDWEFGKHVRGSTAIGDIRAQLFSGLLDRPVEGNEWYEAQTEYLAGLREKHDADGAFIVYVGANGNHTAGFRAFASIHGPSTSLHSRNGWQVFMHEFGHIFGALDEYCPDACRSPSSLQGYLGMINANATYREGDWGGIDNGRGERQPSLMTSNIVNGLNGYTRGAIGHLDTDGDGILEVRDTFPKSDLRVESDRDGVRITGLITDVPTTPAPFKTPFSMNRISALHYRVDGAAWMRLPLNGQRRGREAVDVQLPQLPAGDHHIELRAENSVGNLEPQPQSFDVTVSAEGNAPPHLSLRSDRTLVSTSSTVAVRATALDLDGREPLRVRFDEDGDGRWDTGWSDEMSYRFSPRQAGVQTVVAQAMDELGAIAEASVELLVADRNVAPVPALEPLPSPLMTDSTHVLRAMGQVRDADGDRSELNWKVERDDSARSLTTETGFGADARHTAELTTPLSLEALQINLLEGGLEVDGKADALDVTLVRDRLLAFALGKHGVALVDLADPERPVVVGQARDLQTPARRVVASGDMLYVLGGPLTLIDIRDPANPREVRQAFTERARHRLRSDLAEPIVEGEKPAQIWLGGEWSEPIERLAVHVTVDHTHPEDLTISLVGPDGHIVVLRDKQSARPGRQHWHFNTHNTPALRGFVGEFADGEWVLRVGDDVANKSKGSVESFAIRLDTAHRAVPVHEGATELVGMADESHLVIAGAGLEVLDVSFPFWVHQTARLHGTPVRQAKLVSGHAIVLAQPEALDEEPELGLSLHRPEPLRGLYAIDLRHPFWPRLVRQELDVYSRELAVVGSRLYYRQELRLPNPGPGPGPRPEPLPLPRAQAEFGRPKAWTVVGDLNRFLRGGEYVLAETEPVISSDAFGDDRTLYSFAGAVTKLDVRDPQRITALETFARTYFNSVLPLGRDEILVPGSIFPSYVDLTHTRSIVSQMYRVTLQARDAQGQQREASRSIHLVPYNHAPQWVSVDVVQGTTTRDEWELRLRALDPDGLPSWDPQLMYRADLDGDGIFEDSWQRLAGEEAVLRTRFEEPGLRLARFQLRDGFFATSEVLELPLDVREYVVIRCDETAECPRGEYCAFDPNSECGADRQGVCQPPADDCYGRTAPVCGCDGESYRNACEANEAGASVAYEGFCDHEITECGGPEDLRCSVSGTYCQLPIGEEPADSCGGDGSTFGRCVYRPDACYILLGGPTDARPEGPGIRPGGPRPVCGCDGETYPSACEAARAGVSVEREGTCEPPPPDCRELGCDGGQQCVQCWLNWTCLPEGTVC